MSTQSFRCCSLLLLAMAVTACSCTTQTEPTASTTEQPAPKPVYSNEPGPTDDDAPTEFTETESGLKYRILRKSDGKHPTAFNSVKAHYAGWLDDGTEFDSSYKRGKPLDFPLQGVIAGWTEGMQLIGEGGMIELEIPSELGYGPGGMPPVIPGGATLHFKVELLKVN